jgi:hypothetical protein
MKRTLTVLVSGMALGATAAVAAPKLLPAQVKQEYPDVSAVIEKVREVARLETLEVNIYKKVSFEPDPEPGRTRLNDLVNWATQVVAPPKGRAVVFATAHLGVDLKRITPECMRVHNGVVSLVLPPVVTRVELRPGETEVIASNLNNVQLTRLLEHAQLAMQRDVAWDAQLSQRARQSTERALRAFLTGMGFRDVRFVEEQPRTDLPHS